MKKNYSILLMSALTLQIVNAKTSLDDDDPNLNSYNSLATGFSLLLVQMNSVACLFIFYRTFMIWKDSSSLTFSLKFPFYLAFIEFCMSILQTFDLSSVIATQRTLTTETCNLIEVLSIFSITLIMNLVILVSLLACFSTKSQIMVKDEIIMFLISIVFSIFYAVADIGKDKDENWWCSSLSESIVPLIISLSYILLITLFLLSFILRIKNIKKSTQNNESLESESKRLKVVETEKIASYVFMIWVQLLLIIIYLITQFAMINSVAIGVYYIFAFSVGGVLILIQYIRNESLMHKPNQLNIPKLVVDHAPNEDPDVSQTNSTNCFFGLFHSNKDSSLLSASNSLSPRESFRHSFRDSFRDSFINMKLPFTKIQIQVVQHQTSDFSDNITNDNHVHLETPAISNIS